MNIKGYRIGFVVVLMLALVGLLASLSLSAQLNAAKTELAVLNDQVSVTNDLLATVTAGLEYVEDQLHSTETRLAETQTRLTERERELALYKDTWGSVVTAGVQPPFQIGHLVSSETSVDPTWDELLDFLLGDQTDTNPYVSDSYMCGEFARDVHNNAEATGIRAAFVVVRLSRGYLPCSSLQGFGLDTYHALNAFKTTDRGLVFIDCTGLGSSQAGPSSRDKIVSVRLGWKYRPRSLFPESGWSTRWEDMGTICDVKVYW